MEVISSLQSTPLESICLIGLLQRIPLPSIQSFTRPFLSDLSLAVSPPFVLLLLLESLNPIGNHTESSSTRLLASLQRLTNL